MEVPTPSTNPMVMKRLGQSNIEQAATAELKQWLEECRSSPNSERKQHSENKKEQARLLKELEQVRLEQREMFQPDLPKVQEICDKKLHSEHENLRILQLKTHQQLQDSQREVQVHILERQKLELEMQKLKDENREMLVALGHKIDEVKETLASKVKIGIEELMKEARYAKEKMTEAHDECEKQKKKTSEESKKLQETSRDLEDMAKEKDRYLAESNESRQLYDELLRASWEKRPEEEYEKLQKQIEELSKSNKHAKQQLADARRERSGLIYDLEKKCELVSKMAENATGEYIGVDEGLKRSSRDLVSRNKYLTFRLNKLKKQANDSAKVADDVIHRNETLEHEILELKTKLRSLKDVYDNENEGTNIYELAPGKRPLAADVNIPTREMPSAPPLHENPPYSYPQEPMNFSRGQRHGMFYQGHPPNERPPHVYPQTYGAPPRQYAINEPHGYPSSAPPPQHQGWPPNGHRSPFYPPSVQQQSPPSYKQPMYPRYPNNHQVPEGISQRWRPLNHGAFIRPVGLSPNDASVSRDHQLPPYTNEPRARQPADDMHTIDRIQQHMQHDQEYYN